MSIFTQLQHASYSRFLNIMLIFCCKVTLQKATCSMTKRCRYRFSLLCCQFPRQYRRFRHKRVWSFSHNINHIIYFSPTFFPQNIVQNPQIRLRKTETKHLKRLTFFPRCTRFSIHLKSKNFLSNSKSFFFLCISKNFKVASLSERDIFPKNMLSNDWSSGF